MGVDKLSNDVTPGKRASKRARVLLAAIIRTSTGEFPVRLRDLSRKGALVECKVPPATGSEITFIRGTIVAPAKVAWSAGTRIGLEFLTVIDENDVLIHVAPGRTKPVEQRYRRPRIAGADFTEHERKLARIWSVAVGINVTGD